MNNTTTNTNTAATNIDKINALIECNEKVGGRIKSRKAWEENNSKPNEFIVDFISDEGELINKDFNVWLYDDAAFDTIFKALKNKGLNMDDSTWNPNSTKIEVIHQHEVVEGEEEYEDDLVGRIWKGQAKITRCKLFFNWPTVEEINEMIERVCGIFKFVADNKLVEQDLDTDEYVASLYPDGKFFLDEGFMVNDFKCTYDIGCGSLAMTSCSSEARVDIYVDNFGEECTFRNIHFGSK